jgi:hypothetical protein
MIDLSRIPDPPFGPSYWVLEGKLLASGYPGHWNLEEMENQLRAIADAGIQTVVNLQEEGEMNGYRKEFLPYKERLAELIGERGGRLGFHRIAVPDHTAPKPNQVREALDLIDAALREKRPTLVHCWGGHGRTGVIVGCYLVRHRLAPDGETALKIIPQLRQKMAHSDYPSPEMPDQIELVRSWQPGE